jgi:hypothetical protein
MATKPQTKKTTVKTTAPKAAKKRMKPFWVNFKTGESGRGRFPI